MNKPSVEKIIQTVNDKNHYRQKEKERGKRDIWRRYLKSNGFGFLREGVWIMPPDCEKSLEKLASNLQFKAFLVELKAFNSGNPFAEIDDAALAHKLKVIARQLEPKLTRDNRSVSSDGLKAMSARSQPMTLADCKNVVYDYSNGRRIRRVDIDGL